jgi:hypothetical protein
VSERATFPLAVVAPDPASSRPSLGPRAATDEDVLLRLALWLADVAADAALAATAPASAAAAPFRGATEEPPVSEPTP